MFDFKSLIKYVLEGLAVAVATFLIPSKNLEYSDIILIALTGAAVFAILDQFSPMVAAGTRQGSGFGIGYQQIGLGHAVDPNEESNQEGGCCGQEGGSGCDKQEGGCCGQEGGSGCDKQEGGCCGQEGGCGSLGEFGTQDLIHLPIAQEKPVVEESAPQGFDGFHTVA